MSDALPAITLWEPWATLVALGAKPFEFRRWPAPQRYVGQRIAIHASVRPPRLDELQELTRKLEGPRRAETGLKVVSAMDILERIWDARKGLPLGCVVCTARLGKPIRNEHLARALGVAFVNDSDRDRDQHSNWGWPLFDIRPFEPPIPARGAQGFWMWSPPEDVTL